VNPESFLVAGNLQPRLQGEVGRLCHVGAVIEAPMVGAREHHHELVGALESGRDGDACSMDLLRRHQTLLDP